MRCRRLASAALAALTLAIAPAVLSASDRATEPKNETTVVQASETAVGQFAWLKGVKAVPMSSDELKAVKGQHVHFIEPGNGFSKIHEAGNPLNQGVGTGNWYDNGSPDGGLVAPSYHGLCKAGPIGIPVFPGQLSQCP